MQTRRSSPSPTTSTHGWLVPWRIFVWGRIEKALDDFQVVTGKNPDAISANMTLPELFRWRQERSTVVFPAGFAPPELTADWL